MITTSSTPRWDLQRRVQVTLETVLFEDLLRPLAGKDDQLASYGMQTFAQALAERLNP
jgi:hypothetical protein